MPIMLATYSTNRITRREWGGEYGGDIPLPSRLGVWGSVVSSSSGVRGGAPAANTFWQI